MLNVQASTHVSTLQYCVYSKRIFSKDCRDNSRNKKIGNLKNYISSNYVDRREKNNFSFAQKTDRASKKMNLCKKTTAQAVSGKTNSALGMKFVNTKVLAMPVGRDQEFPRSWDTFDSTTRVSPFIHVHLF